MSELKERIARALASRMEVDYDKIIPRSREHLLLDAQAVIDELGLVEERLAVCGTITLADGFIIPCGQKQITGKCVHDKTQRRYVTAWEPA